MSMEPQSIDFEVSEQADGSMAYSDPSGVAITVYPPNTSIELGPGEYKLTAVAVEVDENQLPHRVKCGLLETSFNCFRCLDTKCVPPKVPNPPGGPLRDAGPQPTPMRLANGLSITPTAITTEANGTILVLDVQELSTSAVSAALLARVGTVAQENIYHVYGVSPSDTPSPPRLEWQQAWYKIVAIPVGPT